MNRPDRSSPGHRRPRFFVRPNCFHREADPPWVELDPDNIHHLRRVLRLNAGARVALFDGTGREYLAEVAESRPNRVELKVLSATRPAVESPLRVTLAQALLKGNAFDRVLTDAAELGARAIVPIVSSRTVVHARRAEVEAKVKRWEKILEAAAAQSGRVLVPRIEYPTSLDEFIRREGEGLRLMLREGAGPGSQLPETSGPEITLLSGPEGGFDDKEAEAALARGFRRWSLGPRILRADTAGPAALAILQHRFGDGQ